MNDEDDQDTDGGSVEQSAIDDIFDAGGFCPCRIAGTKQKNADHDREGHKGAAERLVSFLTLLLFYFYSVLEESHLV